MIKTWNALKTKPAMTISTWTYIYIYTHLVHLGRWIVYSSSCSRNIGAVLQGCSGRFRGYFGQFLEGKQRNIQDNYTCTNPAKSQQILSHSIKSSIWRPGCIFVVYYSTVLPLLWPSRADGTFRKSAGKNKQHNTGKM